jgi:CIC family chloride channel protein
MISNLVSFFISSRLQPQPIYEVLAYQDGIHLPTAESRSGAAHRQVIHAMRPANDFMKAEKTTKEAFEKVQISGLRAWPVIGEAGLIGMLTKAALQKAAADGLADVTLAELVGKQEFPHLHSDQSLTVALERMGAAGLDALPVVSRADVHKLEGIVALQDVLKFYGFASQVETPGPAVA